MKSPARFSPLLLRRGLFVVVFFCLLHPSRLFAQDTEITTLTGLQTGKLQKIDLEAGNVGIISDSNLVTVPIQNILSLNIVNSPAEVNGGILIRLINGDFLLGTPGEDAKTGNYRLLFQTGALGNLDLSMDLVAVGRNVKKFPTGLLRGWPERSETSDKLFYFRLGQPALMEKKDDGKVNFEISKLCRDKKNEIRVHAEYDGTKISKKLDDWTEFTRLMNKKSDAAAIAKIFKDGEKDKKGLILLLCDGSRISLVDAVIEGKNIKGNSLFGPLNLDLEKVSAISFANSGLTFLSNLSPIPDEASAKSLGVGEWVREYLRPLNANETEDAFAKTMTYRMDSSVTGTPITLKGKTYDKGLGVHAYSSLPFMLDGKFSEFHFTPGIADEVSKLALGGAHANIRFSVHVIRDGKKTEVWSREMTIRDEPEPVKIDVKNAAVLILEAKNTDKLNLQNRGNWAQAILIE